MGADAGQENIYGAHGRKEKIRKMHSNKYWNKS